MKFNVSNESLHCGGYIVGKKTLGSIKLHAYPILARYRSSHDKAASNTGKCHTGKYLQYLHQRPISYHPRELNDIFCSLLTTDINEVRLCCTSIMMKGLTPMISAEISVMHSRNSHLNKSAIQLDLVLDSSSSFKPRVAFWVLPFNFRNLIWTKNTSPCEVIQLDSMPRRITIRIKPIFYHSLLIPQCKA